MSELSWRKEDLLQESVNENKLQNGEEACKTPPYYFFDLIISACYCIQCLFAFFINWNLKIDISPHLIQF